ncbi:MAG: adenylate/guanylate cyclase domain-containing protein, partial [Candidatus Eremiobacterota bacterium]
FLVDLSAVRETVLVQVLSIAGLGLAALGGVLWLSRRIASSVTRPVEDLAVRMARVGEGDLEQQAEVAGRDEVAQLATAFNRMTQGLRQKEAFRKLAPEGARREIEKDSRIELGGQWIEATILFSDLRGFTSMSEKMTPAQVVELLNEYLQEMSHALRRHHGDINEYIGDAILAVFHDHEGTHSSALAVAAALDMQAELERLRQKTDNETLRKLRMGIGIHTGDLVEGWIGARDRVKYGVVGDTVNLAARIQDRSRDGKHTAILVSGSTRQHLGNAFELAFFGEEAFKGKTGTTPVWEVVGPA